MQNPGELLCGFHRRLDLVETEIVGDLFGEVDHVVECRREAEYIIAMKTRGGAVSNS